VSGRAEAGGLVWRKNGLKLCSSCPGNRTYTARGLAATCSCFPVPEIISASCSPQLWAVDILEEPSSVFAEALS
jgi:hypothetical protein